MNLQDLDLERLFEAIARLSNEIAKWSEDFDSRIYFGGGGIGIHWVLYDRQNQTIGGNWSINQLVGEESTPMDKCLIDWHESIERENAIGGISVPPVENPLDFTQAYKMLFCVSEEIVPMLSTSMAIGVSTKNLHPDNYRPIRLRIEWGKSLGEYSVQKEFDRYEIDEFFGKALWWESLEKKLIEEIKQRVF